MLSLESFAAERLAGLEARGQRRGLEATHRADGVWVERGGERLLSFSCNDYLGLSHHPRVKAAAMAAVETYGAGSGASRLVTGDTPLMGQLEARLAAWKGTEDACVFGSGYLANAGIIPTLVGPGDLIVIDELAHACLWAGSKLSGAETTRLRHNDVEHLDDILTERRGSVRRVLVATDGVFSMDGDLAPLDRLAEICAAHDAWLLSDDAHGLGVLAEGHGSAALFPGAAIPLQMGTLSKAVGGYGGYLCASRAVIGLMRSRARTFVYSTGLPPASAAAAIAALDIIAEDPSLCARPLARARQFTAALGLPQAQSPIVPVIIGDSHAALAASRRLREQGLLVVAIRPPTVAEGTARLRIAFSALHSEAEVARLAEAVRPLLAA
ncbi:8-amino-7-oxononanoate synthase [Caulobacter ginsengisoli]|uniref:8-amino-7-ketopelargonate synthase n=1 Tax=Caulobacter ginsengisoli TaxID=400775 RepID=A0ABU0IT32_9CAUL|nr:8-amino-7-oxononanoate synthase [Caulobacter ginsengisoli]MDQ0464323.1 8-amino-7-oxononanoate synthase [Caulobacter ginsengisoli]